MKIKYLICTTLLLACIGNISFANAIELPQIKGSVLIAEGNSDYAEGAFFVLSDNSKYGKVDELFREGKLTRSIYLLENGQSPLFALRNYQEAFTKLGEVTEMYMCRPGDCSSILTTHHVWSNGTGRRLESNSDSIDLGRVFTSKLFQEAQMYWYAVIKSEESTYNVSVHSVVRSDYQGQKKSLGIDVGQTITYVQAIEYSNFESDLEYIEATEIQSEITQSGHIALTGLFFDTASDQLTIESTPALAEVAKALTASPELKLYVVGHTDNVGSVTSNQDLSARRAESVAASLVKDYNIASDRFVAIGVGLAAPVTTNKTEAGRALNRRVELVER